MNLSTRRLLPLALLALLVACAGQPRSPAPAPSTPPPASIETGTVEEAPGEHTEALRQASELLTQRQLLPAASILRELEGSKLTPAETRRHRLLNIELLYLQGRLARALALAEAFTGPDTGFPDGDVAWQRWMLTLTEAVHGQLVAARLAADFQARAVTDTRSGELLQHCWQLLNQVSPRDLTRALADGPGETWSGWLELALLATQVEQSPDVQAAEIALWRERHPRHPASLRPPADLGGLSESSAALPRRIALLLPMSDGPVEAGAAFLEGFLAASYRAAELGWPPQEIVVVDSAHHADFDSAYRTCLDAGAEVVIGPMEPGLLATLSPLTPMPVPVITLEWLEAGTGTQQPWQISLSSRDEAAQLARVAFAAGARDALLIRPAGDWGDAVSEALVTEWARLEGRIRSEAVYSGQADYSSSLKTALNIAGSEERATRVRQLMGQPVEFSPRRRDDLDVIFLLAREPQAARSIKPLVAFHYAGDLPVYSTSRIFSGEPDRQRDADLNGILTLEMPWLLSRQAPLPALVAQHTENPSGARMHALGADAFLLNWRLPLLAEHPGGRARGYTGLLHMDAAGRVHRLLNPAVIRNGVPRPR